MNNNNNTALEGDRINRSTPFEKMNECIVYFLQIDQIYKFNIEFCYLSKIKIRHKIKITKDKY